MNQTIKFAKTRLARYYADRVSTWEINSKWNTKENQGRWATRRSAVVQVKKSQ